MNVSKMTVSPTARRLLLESGADKDTTNLAGHTLLGIAVRGGKRKCRVMLEAEGGAAAWGRFGAIPAEFTPLRERGAAGSCTGGEAGPAPGHTGGVGGGQCGELMAAAWGLLLHC